MAKALYKQKAKALYKKITITIEHGDGDVVIECLRVKGDTKLAVGNMVDVIGELSKVQGVLQYSPGCEAIKNADPVMPEAEVLQSLRELAEGDKYGKDSVKLSGKVTEVVKAPSEIPQKLSFYIGALAIFVAGVVYMFMSDLAFNNTAEWLIISTLLSFGSAVMFFLSTKYVEKPAALYSLKACGLLLSVGFVLYIHLFMSMNSYYLSQIEAFIKQGIAGTESLLKSSLTMILSLVLGYMSIVGQAANIVITAVIKED